MFWLQKPETQYTDLELPLSDSLNNFFCYCILISEAFVVCQNYRPLPDYKPTMHNPLLNLSYDDKGISEGANKFVSPFLASGDLQPFDSLRSCTTEQHSPVVSSVIVVYEVIITVSYHVV